MKLNSLHYFIFFMAIVVGGLVVGRVWGESQPSKLDGFAQCIAETDATFYGAFWCPHCQDQKRMFGNAEQYLPYVECSTPDRQNQTQACIDAGIESYPTWEFPDGERQTGAIPLTTLAEKTGCQLPE